MAFSTSAALTALFLFLLHFPGGNSQFQPQWPDHIQVEFALNLEYLETEFFLYGALGHGLDQVYPALAEGGPSPIGAQKAYLSRQLNDIIEQFGYQEVGHLRAIKKAVRTKFSRPLLNLSAAAFSDIMNSAFGGALEPNSFDPYASDINYLLASYLIPYVGLTAYVGTAPNLLWPQYKLLVAGLLGVESGQDAVIRTLLYERKDEIVKPYRHTVAEFTRKISDLRNKLGNVWVIKDEGLVVDKSQGAEKQVTGNILAGDDYSLSYDRTPAEILKIVYGTGDERKFGGFFPKGGGGIIARSYLR